MDAPTDWWKTFFTGPFVDFWLKVTPEEQTSREADFIQGALQVAPLDKLLDVPCGGGRHCRALAERGYRMTGVDLSTDFLAAARRLSEGKPEEIVWEQREMRQLPWLEEFDGAYSFGNSFAYDDDDGNADFLRSVARSLKPGARFILDTGYVMESLLPSLQERGWHEVDDILFLSKRHYDPATSRLFVEYTTIRNGEIDQRSMSARLYSLREIVRLLQDSGFNDIKTLGSLAGEPFKFGSNRLLAVATKKSEGSIC